MSADPEEVDRDVLVAEVVARLDVDAPQTADVVGRIVDVVLEVAGGQPVVTSTTTEVVIRDDTDDTDDRPGPTTLVNVPDGAIVLSGVEVCQYLDNVDASPTIGVRTYGNPARHSTLGLLEAAKFLLLGLWPNDD